MHVYAFLLRNDDSLTTWASQDQGSMVNPSTTNPRPDGASDFKLEHSREAFYGDGADDVAFGQLSFLEREWQPRLSAGAESRAITLSARVTAQLPSTCSARCKGFTMPTYAFHQHGSFAILLRSG